MTHMMCRFFPCKGDIINNSVKLFHPLILFITTENGNRIFTTIPPGTLIITEGCDRKKCQYHIPGLFITNKNKHKKL